MKTDSLGSPFRRAASIPATDTAAAIAARKLGLHGMTPPVFARIDPSICLFAENILFTERHTSEFRYGCHFVLVTPCGTKALPIIPMRLFSRPCVPVYEDLGSTMTEITTSLRLAAPRLRSSIFDLCGAVVAARMQTSDRGSHLGGCRILFNHETSIDVSPHPTPDPPGSVVGSRNCIFSAADPLGGYRGLSAA